MTIPFLPLLAFLGGFLFGFMLRRLLRNVSRNKVRRSSRNIGSPDRLLRLLIAVGLFAWAAFSSWSPTLLFFSGFTLFEATNKWCALYAAMGKNTCPLDS